MSRGAGGWVGKGDRERRGWMIERESGEVIQSE